MFFKDARVQFFKPLTGKYREHICQVLCLLYLRQYGASADYGHSLRREQLVEIIEEALQQTGEISYDQVDAKSEPAKSDLERVENQETDNEERFKTAREHANWVLKQLIDFGWVERQVDPATLQSTFPFSRTGRLFSQTLLEADTEQIRTRHRNTRNTLNALEAFANRGEIYDLLDAFDYSERIVTDFTDVISELEEKKRQLVQEMESQQLVEQAAEQFFEFMEKRFQPDIQVRLSADSVEKHRDNIEKRLQSIRRKPKEFKAMAERELRRTVPDLCEDIQSYLFYILDTIERRMHNAAEVMLPALRAALHGFTKRADIIIRQLSYLNTQHDSDLIDVCRELAQLSPDQFAERMDTAAHAAATFSLQFIDPQHVKLTERKVRDIVNSIVVAPDAPNKEAQCELLIQQLLDQAFVLNDQGMRDYIVSALRGGRKISTREMQVEDVPSLLAMAHAIEVGSVNNLSSDMKFVVKRKKAFVESNAYYHRFDEHEIELIETHVKRT